MLENIKITANQINAVNNNINRPKTPEKPEFQNQFDILDPNLVNKSTKQEGALANSQQGLAFNPYSVAERLLQSLELAPILLDNIKKLMFNKQYVDANIKSNPLMRMFFERFVADINMDKEMMLKFLKFQHNSYTKFNGEFFDVLRDAINANPNDEFKGLASYFLKSFDCYTSITETTATIMTVLNEIKNYLPEMLKDTFGNMMDKMVLENPENSTDINLSLLKNEIIPFLGKYVSKTNDFGPVRDYISILIHDIVRLEKGQRGNFAESTESLLNYMRYAFNLSDKDIADMKHAIIASYRDNAGLKNNSLDFLFKLMDTGINDELNHVNKTTFEGMQQSFLINNSPQVPLIHIFLPVNFNGIFMFSELWISKELSVLNNDKKKSKSIDNEQTYKMFLTFEIDNLGYFETVLYCKNNKLSLDLFIPNGFLGASDKIKSDISKIIKNNNLDISNVYVSECTKARKFNEVFDTKLIKESGVNVIA